jgi:hypothetical protein
MPFKIFYGFEQQDEASYIRKTNCAASGDTIAKAKWGNERKEDEV